VYNYNSFPMSIVSKGGLSRFLHTVGRVSCD